MIIEVYCFSDCEGVAYYFPSRDQVLQNIDDFYQQFRGLLNQKDKTYTYFETDTSYKIPFKSFQILERAYYIILFKC